MRTIQDEIDAIERENATQLDEHGLLKPGGRYRVPMFAMDAASVSVDQRVEDAFRRGYERGLADARKTVQRDPFGRLSATFETESNGDDDDDEAPRRRRRKEADADPRLADARRVLDYMEGRDAAQAQSYRDNNAAEREKAWREMLDHQSNAWKGGDAPTGELAGHGRPGDACMTANKEPGHLNEQLVCVPDRRSDARPTVDAAEGERRKREAWEQMMRDQSEAWRGDRS